MQAPEAANKINKTNGDEECINFRPSPNFKHMKKYLKSKLEEANSTPSQGAETSTTIDVDEQKKVNMAALVQPPLPPNPPPPDSPPTITFKKEIVDEDYHMNNPEETSEIIQSTPSISEYRPEGVTTKKPEKIMCRQFARGACTRGASCIYAHEIILSQLPGVYTFCKNFQNTICTFPKCKFVHATVFEKESYFRTGYLPPHTLAHLKEANVMQPPPIPVLRDVTHNEVPPVFSNPPPPFIHSGVTPIPVLSCVPNVNLENRTSTDIFENVPSSSTSPLKRGWSQLEEFRRSTRDLDAIEPMVKKCKDCDVNEFRLQCSKNKVEKMIASTEEMAKKMSILAKKKHKLYTVLISLFKPMNSKATSSTHGLDSMNIRDDKNKDLMDQLNNFLTPNNRMSHVGDDISKNILGSNVNMSTVLAKLLLNSGERLSPDAS